MSKWMKKIKINVNRKRLAILVTAALLVAALIFAVILPYFSHKISTPSFLQSRGVNWHVFVEEPITLGEIQPFIIVFTDQVKILFKISSHNIIYEQIKNDGRENYTGKEYAGFRPPEKGSIEIPIYFLIGYKWLDNSGKVYAWAGGKTPQYFEQTGDLEFRINIAKESEESDDFTFISDNKRVITTLLHEFGHIMGLKDLYPNGDVAGCEDLPVIMAARAALEWESVGYDSLQRYGRILWNKTSSPTPLSAGGEAIAVVYVKESYYENNTLYYVLYSITYKIEQGDVQSSINNVNVHIYNLNQLRDKWTIEEAAFIGMDGEFTHSCPQEFE